ncbi:unnamed protein product, partial [Soboliphyme baturini]|uniref:PHR domain-containing protein n=1 Tax=Soboliphyme baturini TaxID=241478 RepID=A0A183INU1_9BILA
MRLCASVDEQSRQQFLRLLNVLTTLRGDPMPSYELAVSLLPKRSAIFPLSHTTVTLDSALNKFLLPLGVSAEIANFCVRCFAWSYDCLSSIVQPLDAIAITDRELSSEDQEYASATDSILAIFSKCTQMSQSNNEPSVNVNATAHSILKYIHSSLNDRNDNPTGMSYRQLFFNLMRLQNKLKTDAETCALLHSCLLKLSMASNSHELLLRTSAELLNTLFTSSGENQSNDSVLVVPESYLSLERNVFNVCFGEYNWITRGIEEDLAVAVRVPLPCVKDSTTSHDDNAFVSFAVDGEYIYILCRSYLYKLGSGFACTRPGYEYLRKETPSQDKWKKIICHKNIVCLVGEIITLQLTKDSLKVMSEVTMSDHRFREGHGELVSDGDHLSLIYVDGQSLLHMATLNDSFKIVSDDVYHFDVQLRSFGETYDVSGIKVEGRFPVRCSDLVDIKSSERLTFIITKGGKAAFLNSGCIDDVNREWHYVPIVESVKDVFVNAEGTCAVLVTKCGTGYVMGELVKEFDGVFPFETSKLHSYDIVNCVGLRGVVLMAICNSDQVYLMTLDDHLYVIGRNGLSLKIELDHVVGLKSKNISKILFSDSKLLFWTDDNHLFMVGDQEFANFVRNGSTTEDIGHLDTLRNMIPDGMSVNEVCCGENHIVLLSSEGMIATCGENDYGQLGMGNTNRFFGFQFPDVPSQSHAQSISAGRNHTVILMDDGTAFSFGDHRSGQLGRIGNDPFWHCSAGRIRVQAESREVRVRWIIASGNASFIGVDSGGLPWINEESKVAATATADGCFLFSSQKGFKDSRFLVMRNSCFSITSKRDIVSDSDLTCHNCFDRNNALWRYSASKALLLCLLPFSNKIRGGGAARTAKLFTDPSFSLSYFGARSPCVTVGMNILRMVNALLENFEFYFKRVCAETSRLFPYGPFYCVERHVSARNRYSELLNIMEPRGMNQELEFSSDKDIFLLAVGLCGMPCK